MATYIKYISHFPVYPIDKSLKVVYTIYVRLNKEKKMKKYEPTNKALAIAEIRHQTGLNYTECKKILDQIENKGEGK